LAKLLKGLLNIFYQFIESKKTFIKKYFYLRFFKTNLKGQYETIKKYDKICIIENIYQNVWSIFWKSNWFDTWISMNEDWQWFFKSW